MKNLIFCEIFQYRQFYQVTYLPLSVLKFKSCSPLLKIIEIYKTCENFLFEFSGDLDSAFAIFVVVLSPCLRFGNVGVLILQLKHLKAC